MKKTFALILIAALLLALAACGSGAANEAQTAEEEAPVITSVLPGASQSAPADEPEQAPEETAAPAQSETSDTAEIVARVLEMKGQPVEDLIELLGEPLSRDYSSSCLVEGGQDGQLVYDGFTVYTLVQADGTETIYDCE